MQIVWIVTLTFLVLYICKILHYYSEWTKIAEFKIRNGQNNIRVSVIVPVRNEEKNITKLLDDITEQDYPEQLYEIILVNDHSTDLSVSRIRPFCEKHGNIRLMELGEHLSGKKAAIDAGVQSSAGEIIITTDADCRAGKRWISTITSYYVYHAKPEMIIGLVDMISGNSLFHKFQQFEFTCLVASGAAAAGMSRPVFCNGANLVFKKEAFLKYNDPLNIKPASGDDTLFMLKIKKDFGNRIEILKSKYAITYTKPQPDLRSFIQQRIRWTSKSRYYKDFDILSTAIIVFILNTAVVISLILLLMQKSYLLFPLLSGAKTVTDFIFVKKTFEFFNKRKLVKYIIVFQLVYPFYILIIGILGNFIRYSWKERKLR